MRWLSCRTSAKPKLRLVFTAVLCALLGSLISVMGPLLVQAIGMSDVFPFLMFGNFQMDEKWKEEIADTSNDEAALLSTHELIKRAGFDYENHYALSDDGYITQLIRIINPLADPSQLRYPPVMVQHGQTANSRNFVLQSNRQHFPMPWPRPRVQPPLHPLAVAGRPEKRAQTPAGLFKWDSWFGALDESEVGVAEPTAQNNNSAQQHSNQPAHNPLEQYWLGRLSSNRSLAFMLANNGFDVWLSSTRGVDENNQGFLGEAAVEKLLERRHLEQQRRNMTYGEFELMRKRTKASYWAFTLDDQITHEMPSQILTILNITGAQKITLVGYSNTAMTTLAMLSVRQDIAPHVDATVSIAPVVYYSKLSGWFKLVAGELMQLIPKTLDAELFVSNSMAALLRRLTTRLCTPLPVRYTVCKFIFDSIFGSSNQFMTNLELPFFSHTFRPTSWKCMGQHLQIIKTHKLAKFDYGKKLNLRYYNSPTPPLYNISKINPAVQIGLVAGDLDSWANPATLDEIRRTLNKPPAFDLRIREYNHVDLTAAFDVDVRVNLPVLEHLKQRADHCEQERATSLQRHQFDGSKNGLQDYQDDYQDAATSDYSLGAV